MFPNQYSDRYPRVPRRAENALQAYAPRNRNRKRTLTQTPAPMMTHGTKVLPPPVARQLVRFRVVRFCQKRIRENSNAPARGNHSTPTKRSDQPNAAFGARGGTCGGRGGTGSVVSGPMRAVGRPGCGGATILHRCACACSGYPPVPGAPRRCRPGRRPFRPV
jgi:hypothetical protein